MRWSIVRLAGLLGMSAAFVGLLNARAQQFSPLAADAATTAAPDDAPPGRDIAQHRMRGWQPAILPDGPQSLGLVFTPADRALSQADVQKIAEAWLVWHGNHAWHVTSLTSDTERVIFAIATAENTVIATFEMNRHTGAVLRTG